MYSRACVVVGMDVVEWVPVNVGLKKVMSCLYGCLMSIWIVWWER